jgi:hypothetical protein
MCIKHSALNGYGGINWDYGGPDLLYYYIQASDRPEENSRKTINRPAGKESNTGYIEYNAKMEKIINQIQEHKNCSYTDYNLRNLVSL